MKIIQKILILSTALLFLACTTKTPFKGQEPLKDAALVYVYASDAMSGDDSMQDSKFKLQINNQNVVGNIRAGEYKVFDMKPAVVLYTSVRKSIERENLKLNLKKGKTYYLKIEASNYGEPYLFAEVSASVAKKDLQKSALAGSFEIDTASYVPDFAGSTAGDTVTKDGVVVVPAMTEAQIDAIIEKKLAQRSPSTATKSTPQRASASKLDEIKEAYEMKKSGILSDAEFKTMKAEILAK